MTKDKKQARLTRINKTIAAYSVAIDNGTLQIDSRSHFKLNEQNIQKFKDRVLTLSTFGWFVIGEDYSELEKFENLLQDPTEEFYKLTTSSDFTCYACGEYLQWETKGKVIRAITLEFNSDYKVEPLIYHNDCIFKEGLPEIVNYLDVRSGKMVFANVLHPFFPSDEELFGTKQYTRKYDINTYFGEINYTQKYFEAGLATGFVGNGCTHIFQNKNTIYIGCEGYDDETIDMTLFGAKQVSDICTDLWWFSCADYNLLKSKNSEMLDEYITKKVSGAFVVNVDPGRYKFTHRYHSNEMNETLDIDEHDGIRYTTIEKIG